MKRIKVLAFSVILIMSCQQSTPLESKGKEEKVSDVDKVNNEVYLGLELVDIERELNVEYGDYFITYRNGNLSLCCNDELFNPCFGLDSNQLRDVLKDKKIKDTSLSLVRDIRVGMSKREFLDTYFLYTQACYDSLTQLAVCEDERGYFYTKYKFRGNKLQEIEFESFDEY